MSIFLWFWCALFLVSCAGDCRAGHCCNVKPDDCVYFAQCFLDEDNYCIDDPCSSKTQVECNDTCSWVPGDWSFTNRCLTKAEHPNFVRCYTFNQPDYDYSGLCNGWEYSESNCTWNETTLVNGASWGICVDKNPNPPTPTSTSCSKLSVTDCPKFWMCAEDDNGTCATDPCYNYSNKKSSCDGDPTCYWDGGSNEESFITIGTCFTKSKHVDYDDCYYFNDVEVNNKDMCEFALGTDLCSSSQITLLDGSKWSCCSVKIAEKRSYLMIIIIAAAAGTVVLVVLIIICCCCYHHKKGNVVGNGNLIINQTGSKGGYIALGDAVINKKDTLPASGPSHVAPVSTHNVSPHDSYHSQGGGSGRTVGEYTLLEFLGKGSFGEVYKCRKNDKYFAIKEVADGGAREIEQACADRLSARMNCPFLVKYFDTVRGEKGKLYLVMELCQQGDLRACLNKFKLKQNEIPELQYVMKILVQMLIGLHVMRRYKVLHRDLKPENVFIDQDSNIKIGDFGAGREMESTGEQASTLAGTILYMAPEILRGEKYDFSADMWSLGVMLYELCTMQWPFYHKNTFALKDVILEGKYKPIGEDTPAEVRGIVDSLLTLDRSLRPTPLQILQQEFVRRHAENLGLLNMYPAEAK